MACLKLSDIAIAVLSICTICYGQDNLKKYRRINIDSFMGGNLILTDTFSNVVECVFACKKNPNCQLVLFSANNGTCLGYAQVLLKSTGATIEINTDVAVFTKQLVDCEVGSVLFKSSCYTYKQESVMWPGARDACISFGGHLVTVTNRGEKNVILDIAEFNGGYQWAIAIGATYNAIASVWQWENGETWLYDDWADGQPVAYSGTELCAYMVYMSTVDRVKWEAGPCTFSNWYMCEKNVHSLNI